ncbi:MAG TPA: hypothetical protein VJZ00_08005 [Thermoanaerobaculia bacterium]|nr:hypothetical protein [Thermoanaerobaculia bacterium]
MGIALWITCGLAAFLFARFVPRGRTRAWIGELIVAVVTAFLLGVVATALDFGGWREPFEWRAGLFAFFGSAAAVGIFRLRT